MSLDRTNMSPEDRELYHQAGLAALTGLLAAGGSGGFVTTDAAWDTAANFMQSKQIADKIAERRKP